MWAAEADKQKDAASVVMKEKYKDLGKCTWHEAWVGGLFVLCMFLWFLRSPKIFTGWGDVMTADYHPKGT